MAWIPPPSSPAQPSPRSKRRLFFIGPRHLVRFWWWVVFPTRVPRTVPARGRDPPSKPWFGSVIRPVPQSTGPPGFLSWPLRIGRGEGAAYLTVRDGGQGKRNERTNERRPVLVSPCHAMRSCYCRPCLLGMDHGFMDGQWPCCCDLRSVRLSKHAVPLRRFYCPPPPLSPPP